MNIYIGNIAPQVSDSDLESLFKPYGELKSVKIIRDIFSGESKGFGFVEMIDNSAAEKAISELNTKELGGKKIIVNEARPKSDNRRGGRSGGRGGNFRSGGGKRR